MILKIILFYSCGAGGSTDRVAELAALHKSKGAEGVLAALLDDLSIAHYGEVGKVRIRGHGN